MTTDWIARACQEALDKKLVPSDAHAEALKLVIQAHHAAFLEQLKAKVLGAIRDAV